jgi:MoaA/NifB/PqqE/SkfB family radical SAM enzyme
MTFFDDIRKILREGDKYTDKNCISCMTEMSILDIKIKILFRERKMCVLKNFANEKMEKVYIEVTSRCNLSCSMCSRNFWENEKISDMDFSLFEKIIDEIRDEKSIKTVFFGGVGEPLMHPNILDMIKLVKRAGKRAELITNGTLLNDKMISDLKRTWLDQIWVSVDDAHELSFTEKWSGFKYTVYLKVSDK